MANEPRINLALVGEMPANPVRGTVYMSPDTSGNFIKVGVDDSVRTIFDGSVYLKKVTVDGSVLTPDASGVVNIPAVEYMTYITYAELKNLRDTGSLVPGMQYRITDYHTTVTPTITNARSADHQFDVIVRADDASHLNENGYAAHHEGDEYFANCNLEAWELQYRLDNEKWSEVTGTYINVQGGSLKKLGTVEINGKTYILWDASDLPFSYFTVAISEDDEVGTNVYDYDPETGDTGWYWMSSITSKFDIEGGQGTILMMKDEYGNQFPYDFKNIQFKRWAVTDSQQGRTGLEGKYMCGSTAPKNISKSNDNFIWAYTFSSNANGGEQTDYSLDGTHDVYNNMFAITNPISDLLDNVFYGTNNNHNCFEGCSGNTFGGNCCQNSFEKGCSNNSFGNSCQYNSFGNSCQYNSFGDYCQYNSFGNSCGNNSLGNYFRSNLFENYCNNNTFGNSCGDNVFENYCNNNTFGNSCSENSLGNYCSAHTFGNNCQYNSFGNGCRNNLFGDYCQYNSFGNSCGNNSFGVSCYSNSLGDLCYYIKFGNYSSTRSYYRYIIVENGNQNIYLDTTQTTSSSSIIKNIKIAQGVNNTSTWKTITHNTVNDTFQTVYQPANSRTISV